MENAARSPLHGILAAGRSGLHDGEPGVRLSERGGLAMSILLAHRGRAGALRASLASLGYDLPATPRRTEGPGLALVWSGADQWLVLGEARAAAQTRNLFAPLADRCSLVTADDARTVVSIGGPRARDALAKLVAVDLHPRVFKPGDVAVTPASGIPAILWQAETAPRFEVAVPRSFARSFWAWMVEASAEYGCLVEAAAP